MRSLEPLRGCSFFIQSDILLNDAYTWSTTTQNASSNIYDIQSVVAHEIGHSLGIAHSDDDQLVARGTTGTSATAVVGWGEDATITTARGGDDELAITSGFNGYIATAKANGDDYFNLSGTNVYGNYTIINAGLNGTLETTPTGDDYLSSSTTLNSGGNFLIDTYPQGDDNYAPYIWIGGVRAYIRQGVDGDLDSLPPGGDDSIAITAGPDGVAESGYGLVDVPTMNRTASWSFSNSLEGRSLATDDKNACNFLYSMDMGDAPDPLDGNQRYPTRIHDPDGSNFYNQPFLNGIGLRTIDWGAVHWFGVPGFRYEWLGDNEDGDECNDGEARQGNNDNYDDGLISLTGNPVAGGSLRMKIRVSIYNRLLAGLEDHMGVRYLNAYADWNNDKMWLLRTGVPLQDVIEEEKIIGTGVPSSRTIPAGTQTFTTSTVNTTTTIERDYQVRIPTWSVIDKNDPLWLRFRLDYEEDAGMGVKTPILTYMEPFFAAIFGEVEDYPLLTIDGSDSTPPTTSKSTSSPPAASNWYIAPTNVELSINELGYTYYKLGSHNWTTFTTSFDLPEGETALSFYSVDLNNNKEATQTFTYKVDYTFPTRPSNALPTSVSSTSFTSQWGASTDTVSGLSQYSILRSENYNGPWTLIATVPATSTNYSDTPPDRNIWYYKVKAADNAGNESDLSPYVPYVYMDQSIGPGGGTLSSEDNRVALSMPAGALSSNQIFTVDTKEIEWPPGLTPMSVCYEITPSQVFDQPVTLTFEWNPANDPPSGVTPAVYWYDAAHGFWRYLGGTVDRTNRTVTVPVNHFSIFGIAWGNALQGPHGGYIDTSDKCKACHDIHDAQSGYALLVRSNIFNTCQYCHDGTGAENIVYRQIYSPDLPADYGHRMATGVTVIPGGDTTVTPRGSDSGLTCTHCHSPHGNELQMISQSYYCDATQTVSNHLLKNDPGRATGTVSFYGAAWCADCHDRRHSNRTDVNNHPVNLSLSYLSASIARDNTNFRMDPINPSNARTYPICQHCHEDRRNAETAFSAPVEPPTSTSNPVYNNFPHESETRYLVAETRDDLCLNCHATGSLP